MFVLNVLNFKVGFFFNKIGVGLFGEFLLSDYDGSYLIFNLFPSWRLINYLVSDYDSVNIFFFNFLISFCLCFGVY